MHWVQGEKPVEYHVVRWENSAFHNHDKRPERKMLGGVSFDGGAGGGKSMNTQQTGVQTAQPSFSHTIDEGWFGNGMGEAGLYGDGKEGLSGERNDKTESGRAENDKSKNDMRVSGNRTETDAHGVRDNRDTLEIRTVPELAENKVMQELTADITMTEAEAAASAVEAVSSPAVPEEKRRRPFGRMFDRMKSGIQDILREMEQRAGQKNNRKSSKKNGEGTRAVTKEEFDRIKTDKSYLLDSYNKYGERSTLGE